MTAPQQVEVIASALSRTAGRGGADRGSRSTPLIVVPDSWAEAGGQRPRRATGHPRARRYLGGYLRWLRISDLLVIVIALGLTTITRFGFTQADLAATGVGYTEVSLGLAVAWVLMLNLHSAYDGRFTGHGVQEYRQVFHASLMLFAVLAIGAYALKVDVARGYVLLAFPLGTLLLLASRYAARRWLVRQRRAGQLSDRVLLVGDRDNVEQLVVALRRTPDAGYNVLGACVDDAPAATEVAGVPVVGSEGDVLVRAVDLNVDVIAVSSSAGLGSSGLRRLGWALEGTDIDLVVAPGIMDVAGPRVRTRPVQGLPLIHVEAPTFDGPALVVKNLMDRAVAALGLALLSPVFLCLAAMIAFHDRGPVFFRQERVGRDGRTFRMLKFRTMHTEAEAALPSLMAANDGAGPLFKIKDDPRVTRLGRVLRRYSVDELPQLINVLRGEMSLVGPRPPLPREVLAYEADTRRRLLVKPGMTGMWQIGGRSNLSWTESVRLDLYYVENWTPLLDLMILWRTVRVVTRPDDTGAF
ncbi:sugar transferase [Ornithinimicrobium sp. F0845]|uniref:sugar transferase n=1 Tax=Ornithinimicrobium sp. F0845 TaxID=2926412 RepID=UPI001FF4C8C8|nr:sugar transferase [Ornithinimicrobium sp. F0845]MCK0112302.1 sugar transferase [Ornithinimicrobium sp. F0845]